MLCISASARTIFCTSRRFCPAVLFATEVARCSVVSVSLVSYVLFSSIIWRQFELVLDSGLVLQNHLLL